MELNEDLIHELTNIMDSTNLKFTLDFANKLFSLDDVKISKAITPVTKRTQRGGVYFSDVEIFRINAQIKEKEIVPLISKVMLGPNTEFADVKITTNTIIHGNQSEVCLHTNLTNSMENSSFVELTLTVIGTELN